MDALLEKRTRLQQDPRNAGGARFSTDDGSATTGNARTRWADYLAAKDRLVLAYVEQPPTIR